MEVKLPIVTRIKLRFHYLICLRCQRYEEQLRALGNIASSLLDDAADFSETLPDSSKERLKQTLHERKPE